jgi:signal recognition particle subunit SEC65
MSGQSKKTDGRDERTRMAWDEPIEAELAEALKNFRLGMTAWSDRELSRPRAVAVVHRRVWRLAAGWALGCVLIAGAVSGGVYEQHRAKEEARVAALQKAEQQRLAAVEQAREEEELLAKVDSDVSREVPSAMEPLAQMMAEDENQ